MAQESALLFSLLTAVFTLAGGALLLFTKLKDIGSRYLIAFASGTMIAVAFFGMLPSADIATNSLSLGLGFFLLYLLEKSIMIHACHEEECEIHAVGWISIFGIALESIADGIAIAVGFALNAPLGIAIVFAVIAHEVPSGFRTAAIWKHFKYPTSAIMIALAIDAFFAPIGTLIAPFFPFSAASLLAFTAGTFLYIGASDLLPEAHQRFNYKVVISVFLGVFSILAIETLTAGLL